MLALAEAVLAAVALAAVALAAVAPVAAAVAPVVVAPVVVVVAAASSDHRESQNAAAVNRSTQLAYDAFTRVGRPSI